MNVEKELLVFGYIRQIEMVIPFDIMKTCCDFYTYYELIRFSIYNSETSESTDNFTCLKSKDTGCNKLFVSEKGFNSGYHQWKIKCVHSNGNAGVGVIINNKNDIQSLKGGNYWLFNRNFEGSYYWYSDVHGSRIQYYKNGNQEWYHDIGIYFVTNDIITIRLDCNKWKLQFSKLSNDNKTEIEVDKEFDIQNNCTYYPAVCFCENDAEFKLLID
eukprot:211212_1